ncbi:hypothetical protein TNCV_3044791 [Trichonephila clavipes]|nr:hypothetical protein TNCV_3044791 [Trichonephila clavipes]
MDKDIEFYVIQPKENKPIKVVVKGLPGCTKPNEIISDLEDQAAPLHPTKPGTTSQGTFRSRYGVQESVQVPVPKMSR